ncbi:MAG TPA: prepilin-type N-terminal cleavage/methylation domain-containing protein [Lacunisphaera sp.]|nr:prepilin-type N-terminal cleavage/methylation domain-containing protein [Lacunisphaera sp.]
MTPFQLEPVVERVAPNALCPLRTSTNALGAARSTRGANLAGFTLVEVLVSMSLAAAVLAAVLSSFVFLGRNLARLANNQTLEAKGREALTYLRRDFALAEAVKTGTTPTASSVTLVLPAGEVTYTFDSAAGSLRRQSASGANPDFLLLKNDRCACTTFAFDYYTTTGGAPTSQLNASANVPYGIKQIQVRFVLETPGTQAAATRVTYEAVSSRFLLRNKQPATGG